MTMNIEWINTTRLGGQVTRCHTVPTIRQHNNAEHTAGALVIAKELCEANGMSLTATAGVLEYLMVHDTAEMYCGDVPANVKKEHKKLADELDVVEQDWETRNVPFSYVTSKDLSQQQRWVARCADLLELGYFCVEEAEMGNKRIHPVWENVLHYVIPFEEDINGVFEVMSELRTRWRKAHS